MPTFWRAFAGLLRRHAWWVVLVAIAATPALAIGVFRLSFSTGQDTIVPASSQVYQDNLRYQRQFGGDPMLVLFEGDILRLLSGDNLDALAALEDELNATGLYHAVLSPRTTLEFARDQIALGAELALDALARQQGAAAEAARQEAAAAGASREEQEAAAEAARQQVAEEFQARTAQEGQRLAAAGEQSLDNPAFVEFLIFDGEGTIRPDLQGIFPDEQHALMVVRLNGNLTIDEQAEAAARTVEIVESYTFDGLSVLPTGSPLLVKEINDNMQESMARMSAIAVAIMIAILLLIFRARWRLLSLPVVLLGCLWAFGLLGFVGVPLTMVTISGLPILIGLGVDFAVQFHYRFEEEAARSRDAGAGLSESLAHLAPAITIAVVAASVGFLALRFSAVPMIRDFGLMLTVGIVILFVAGLTLLDSVLFLRDRRRRDWEEEPSRLARLLHLERYTGLLARWTSPNILPVTVVAVAVTAAGLVLDGRIPIESDPERFVSQDSPTLADLRDIRDVAGSSSELGLLVEADAVLDTHILQWMAAFERRQIEQHPEEILRSGSIASTVTSVTGAPPIEEEAEALLGVAPEAIEASFVSEDRSMAHVIFAIGPISLREREVLIDEMTADLDAPRDVDVTASGLAVVGIEAVHALSVNRPLMMYSALGAIFLALLVFYRNLVKAAAPLAAVLVAIGSSSLLLYVTGNELNPLTSVSGPLIIAMSTEFSIILMSRYFEERSRADPREAMLSAATLIGRAITVSGLTVIGGFGVLAFSGFPLLNAFGRVTALNIGLALASALLVLPPLLVWADERGLVRKWGAG